MLIKTFYQDILGISDEKLLRLLCDATDIRHFAKGELLISVGEHQTDMLFLRNGVVRGFYFDAEGRDITDCLITKSGLSIMSCFDVNQAFALVNVETLVETDMFRLPITTVKELLEIYPELIRVYNRLLIQYLHSYWEVKGIVSQKSAADCYQWFLRAYPGLIDQISNKHIASFLGMTPVTLSRLRRVVRENDDEGSISR